MLTVVAEIEANLRLMTDDAFAQIDGVPADDVNNWRPALGLEDINTFYALITHLIGSGEWWILSIAAQRPSNRDRPAEFGATGDLTRLRRRADEWLDQTHDWLTTLDEADLGRVVHYVGPNSGEAGQATVAYCLVHAVEHTATHVGHLQLQRQIWNAEHRAGR